jgi:hypothetical protein
VWDKGGCCKTTAQKNERGVSQLSFFVVKCIYENKPTATTNTKYSPRFFFFNKFVEFYSIFKYYVKITDNYLKYCNFRRGDTMPKAKSKTAEQTLETIMMNCRNSYIIANLLGNSRKRDGKSAALSRFPAKI